MSCELGVPLSLYTCTKVSLFFSEGALALKFPCFFRVATWPGQPVVHLAIGAYKLRRY